MPELTWAAVWCFVFNFILTGVVAWHCMLPPVLKVLT